MESEASKTRGWDAEIRDCWINQEKQMTLEFALSLQTVWQMSGHLTLKRSLGYVSIDCRLCVRAALDLGVVISGTQTWRARKTMKSWI